MGRQGRPASALNHIAHFLLAPHTAPGAAGTLLADFHRGAIGPELPPEVARAIALHRAIDGHTDRHPVSAGARSLFDPGMRRYAGVALDVHFDHCLARRWDRHAAVPFEAFVQATYARLEEGLVTLDLRDPPERLHGFARAMIDGDWLGEFRRFEGVERTLERLNYAIRRRFGREVDLRPLAGELRRLHDPLEQAFDALFPDLVTFVATRAESDDQGEL